MSETRFVPADFALPDPIETDRFRLRSLGPEHNESDYAAWTSSIEFIRGLPGWASSSWPAPMSVADNLRDCTSHRARAESGTDFAYTVLLPDRDEVIGCVYFKPTRPPLPGVVDVRSWVTAAQADLDRPLHDAVRAWLATDWPWPSVDYAAR